MAPPAIDFAVARYNANGTLDTSFSGDGKQTTDFGRSSEASAVAIQGDGKIVAVGATESSPYDFALARYNANGSLDTSFSGDGKQTTAFGSSSGATGVALQADGKIVAVGSRPGPHPIRRLRDRPLSGGLSPRAGAKRATTVTRRTVLPRMGAAGFEPATSRV